MTLGYAIPVHGGHSLLIPRVLDSIQSSTVLPDIVSMSISGIKPGIKLFDPGKYNFEIIYEISENGISAGRNRNIAASKLDTEIITFFDADDMVHYQRNEIIKKSFENENVHALVHNWYHGHPPKGLLTTEIKNPDIKYDYIDTLVPGCGFPQSSIKHYNYANGHVSVRKNIFEKYKFEDQSISEDTHYNRKLVEDGYKITYVYDYLCAYIH